MVGGWFLWFTRGALTSYFSPDDVTNLYRAWSYPLDSLFKANLLFFLNSDFYRPLASVWYRVTYDLAGFNPMPFHAVNLVILAANLWLTYCLIKRLTQSKEIGAVAALLIAYLPAGGPLYFDTGFIFDVLCYFFYFCALLLYVRIRQQERPLRAAEIAACMVLFVFALGSKELAVTLPAAMALYELLYPGVPWRSPGELWRWLFHEGRAMLAASCITIVFTAGHLLDHSRQALSSMGAYRPAFTFGRWIETTTTFIDDLFLRVHPMSHNAVLGTLAALFVCAWAFRSRTLKFAFLFLMLSPIPVAFIPPRGAPQYYIVIFGWALFAAVVVVRSVEFLLRLLPRALQPGAAARAPVMLALCGLLLFPFYRNTGWETTPSVSLEAELIRQIVTQMRQLYPQVKPGAHILFLNDPVDDDYRLLFLARLNYRDMSILVQRMQGSHPAKPEEIAQADYVLDYRRGLFFNSRQAGEQGPQPAIEFEWGQPLVYREGDFHRITRSSPAKAGEMIIARVTDLGSTEPPVPAGQPFPQDPLLPVAAPVSVRIGGDTTGVGLKIGWPGAVNSYRIDFPLPADAHGDVSIRVIAGGVVGPPVVIPVQ